MRALLFLLALAASGLSGRAQEWKSLFDGKTLAGWKEAAFAGGGAIEIENGVLILNQGYITGVNYTNETPKLDYEVAWEAKRIMGNDFFCALTFPVKDTFCTFIVGGWGGGVVGLSSLDGDDAAHNDTTKFRRFDRDKWFKFRLRVTENNISAWIDDDQVLDTNTKGRTITLRPGDIELSKPFGFATYSTTGGLRDIKLRKVKPGEPAVEQPAPKADAEKKAPAKEK